MRQVPNKSTPFVGRDIQLAELTAIGKTVFEQKQGKVIFLIGEAGIGKTTLGEYFSQFMQEKYPRVRYAYANCSEKTGEISPYTPFVQLHQNLLEEEAIQSKEDENEKNKWFWDYAHEVGPDFFDIIPVLGPALKVLFKSTTFAFKQHDQKNTLQEKPSLLNQINVFQKFTDSLRYLANRNSLLLFVDDWHWADESSTNLLFHISRQLADVPILFLITCRQHEAEARQHPILAVRSEMHRYNLCVDIYLDFLSQESITEYLNKRFSSTKFEPSFIGWLQRITNGNALFLNEYIELLLKEERLTNNGQLIGSWQEIQPPKSVEGVIHSRIRYLDVEDHRILLYASIEGERFSTLFLERVSGLNRLSLLSRLRNIEKTHQLISEKGTQGVSQQLIVVYQFVHVIVYQSFYNELSEGERVELSRKLLELQSEFFEKADTATKSQMLPKLIELANIVSDYLAKAKYALQAANEAAETYAHSEVFKQCNAGIEALDKLSETAEAENIRMDLLFRRGDTRWWFVGEWEQALNDFLQIEHTATKKKDSRQLIRIYDRIGLIYEFREEYDKAIEFTKKALNIEGVVQTDYSNIYYRISDIYSHRDDYKNALEWAQKAHSIVESTADQGHLARSLMRIAIVYTKSGNYERGLVYAQKAVSIGEILDDESLLVHIYNQIGYMQLVAERDYDQALKSLQKAAAISQKLNKPLSLAVNYHNIASIYRRRKEYEIALEWFQKVAAIREKLRDLRNLAITWSTMGKIAVEQEQLEKALDFFTRSFELFSKIGLPNDAKEVEESIKEVKSKHIRS